MGTVDGDLDDAITAAGPRLRALRRALDHIMRHRDKLWITTVGGVNAHVRSLPSGMVPGAPG